MTRPRFIVTGTDTGIGKTVFAGALVGALDAFYWKPVQAGVDPEGTDAQRVAALSGAEPARILPERYCLSHPLSPHRAAELDGVEIDPAALELPDVDGPLIIEGAGGVLVPLNRRTLYADLFAQWQVPVILVARTALGTINHSLLSLEALRSRGVPVHGIAFVGESIEDSEATICDMGRVKRLGRLPVLADLTQELLAAAFAENFDLRDFAA
jgi:dethiobiotin synthetase